MAPPKSLLLMAIMVIAAVQAAKKLPHFIQVCHRSDPDLDGCVLKSIESLRGRLGRGIPQLQVPGYEPLMIPGVHIDSFTDALEINANLENFKVSGASKFIITSLKMNLDDNGLTAKVSLKLPELQFSTEFDVNGRLLAVPLTGKGSVDGNLTDVSADLIIQGTVVERKNKKYLQIAGVTSDIRLGDSTQLSFKGPKQGKVPQQGISSVATSFINNNKGEVLQLIKPILEDTVNEIFKEIANRIFQVVPYDTLLPE